MDSVKMQQVGDMVSTAVYRALELMAEEGENGKWVAALDNRLTDVEQLINEDGLSRLVEDAVEEELPGLVVKAVEKELDSRLDDAVGEEVSRQLDELDGPETEKFEKMQELQERIEALEIQELEKRVDLAFEQMEQRQRHHEELFAAVQKMGDLFAPMLERVEKLEKGTPAGVVVDASGKVLEAGRLLGGEATAEEIEAAKVTVAPRDTTELMVDRDTHRPYLWVMALHPWPSSRKGCEMPKVMTSIERGDEPLPLEVALVGLVREAELVRSLVMQQKLSGALKDWACEVYGQVSGFYDAAMVELQKRSGK